MPLIQAVGISHGGMTGVNIWMIILPMGWDVRKGSDRKKIRTAFSALQGRITGTHHPGVFSGHNYEKLMNNIDFIMPYNIGDSFELMRGLNPDFLYMHPTWKNGDKLKRQLWYQFLHGSRGVLFWDNFEEKHKFIDRKNKTLTARAKTAAPVLKEIQNGLDKLLLKAKRDHSGIAIYYSYPSIRVNWVQQNISLGRKWIKRNSSAEYKNDYRNLLRSSWIKLIEDNGFQFIFITPKQLSDGRLEKEKIKLLILPEIWAMGQNEAEEIKDFVRKGGTVIADQFTGLFDQHGKRYDNGGILDLAMGISQKEVTGDIRFSNISGTESTLKLNSNISDICKKNSSINLLNTKKRSNCRIPVLPSAINAITIGAGNETDAAIVKRKYGKGLFCFLNLDLSAYTKLRSGNDTEKQKRTEMILDTVKSCFPEKLKPFAEQCVWQCDNHNDIFAVWRNFNIRQDGGNVPFSNSVFEKYENITILFNQPCFVVNKRTGKNYGQIDKLTIELSPWEPIILSISKKPFDDH